MTTELKLTDNYYGQPCKVLLGPKSFVSQEEVIELKQKYPNYEIKEIGCQGDNIGYRYKYAAFKKNCN
jgi:hypothetical protein